MNEQSFAICNELRTARELLRAKYIQDRVRGIKRFENAAFYLNEHIKRSKLKLSGLDALRDALDNSFDALRHVDAVAINDSVLELSAMCGGLITLLETKGV